MYWILYKKNNSDHWRIYLKRDNNQIFKKLRLAQHAIKELSKVPKWDDFTLTIVSSDDP